MQLVLLLQLRAVLVFPTLFQKFVLKLFPHLWDIAARNSLGGICSNAFILQIVNQSLAKDNDSFEICSNVSINYLNFKCY